MQKRNTLLRDYSLLTTSLLAFSNIEGNAQVIYTDLDPDLELDGGDTYYELDMNADGINDFAFDIYTQTVCGYCGTDIMNRLIPLESNSVVSYLSEFLMCSSHAYTIRLADDLADDILIDPSLNFQNGSDIYVNFFSANFYCNWGPPDAWPTAARYAGVRFNAADGQHYGWIRMKFTVPEYGLEVYDYAYEATPDTGILTTIKEASPATEVHGEDIGITGSGTDLQFQFTKPDDETSVAEYRVIACKSTESLTAAAAMLLEADQYISILPDGSPVYENTFTAFSRDAQGDDLILPLTSYKIYVLSVANADYAFVNVLSATSADISLTDSLLAAHTILAEDINDFGNGADLKILFSSPADESLIEEYRVMVVPSAQADTFDLNSAAIISEGNYISVTPGSISYEITLGEDATDINGGLILAGTGYKIFVLSVNNTKDWVVENISAPSAEIILSIPDQITENINSGFLVSAEDDHVIIQLSFVPTGETIFTLNDNTGRKVFETLFHQSEYSFTTSLPPGMYIATLQTENKTYSQKIIIQ